MRHDLKWPQQHASAALHLILLSSLVSSFTIHVEGNQVSTEISFLALVLLQVVMLAEVIPVAQQQFALALAIVPSSMMNIRPKMNIKVLGGADAEQQHGKKGKGRN